MPRALRVCSGEDLTPGPSLALFSTRILATEARGIVFGAGGHGLAVAFRFPVLDEVPLQGVEAANGADSIGVPSHETQPDGDLNDDHSTEGFAEEVRAAVEIAEGAAVGNAMRAADRLGCVVLPCRCRSEANWDVTWACRSALRAQPRSE